MLPDPLFTVGLVLILLPFSAPHPQCLDFQPPFEDDRVTYCQEYTDFGCCTRELDQRAQDRVEFVRKSMVVIYGEPYLLNVSCLKCSPYAAHIFDTEDSGVERRFPILCRSYCEEASQKCHPALMDVFGLLAQDFGFVEDPTPVSYCSTTPRDFAPNKFPRNRPTVTQEFSMDPSCQDLIPKVKVIWAVSAPCQLQRDFGIPLQLCTQEIGVGDCILWSK